MTKPDISLREIGESTIIRGGGRCIKNPTHLLTLHCFRETFRRIPLLRNVCGCAAINAGISAYFSERLCAQISLIHFTETSAHMYEDAPEFDQRGSGFLRIVNGTIDIGAFEVQATGAPSTDLAVLLTADFSRFPFPSWPRKPS